MGTNPRHPLDALNPHLQRKLTSSLSLAGAAISIIFVAIMVLSRQACVCLDITRLSSRQKYACRDKTFVATNIFFCGENVRSGQIFVATNIFFKLTFVATNTYCTHISRQPRFSRQTFSRDKYLSRQTFFKLTFVATNTYFTHISRQPRFSRQTFSRDKYLSRQTFFKLTFAATNTYFTHFSRQTRFSRQK